MTERDHTNGAAHFLEGGGEMGALMRSFDWSASPLGSPEGWPDALKMSVSICLNSRFPMVLWWGPECIMLYNDAWRPVLGATKHPAGLGRPGVESWPEIWDIIGAQMRGVLERGEASWSEDLLLAVERYGYKEEAYFTYSYSPIKDAGGRIGGVFSAVSETTERVLGERRLRTLRELAARTADAKSVEAACATFAEVLGAGNPDLPFAMLYLDSEDRSGVRLLAASGIDPARVAADADPWRADEVVRTGHAILLDDLPRRFGPLPGGVWPEPTTQALVLPVARAGQHADTTGVLVAGINPRRALDAEYRGFLELVAGHMATAVSNARAYEEERRRAEALAEIDRAKTTFFSNASHEFRTPLTLLLSPLQDLLMRHPTAHRILTERHELELMHRNALRLLKLVNTLLDFSRIEAGRVQAIYQPLDLAAYTAELASTFRSAMDRAGLSFVVDCPPLPTPVYVDRDMWEKIVLNLVSNAFKYTLEGEIAVALHRAPDGRNVELTVSDTGVGIPAAELPRLFERFHRIEGQRGRTQEGTGIGLALVQELVRLHGGSVAVESVVGRGSRFRISLPTGFAHLPADRVQGERTLPGTAVTAKAFVDEALRWLPGGGSATEPSLDRELLGPPAGAAASAAPSLVLLADDNADMRDYVRRLLAGRHEVLAVADGQAALETAKGRRPDLVLSDIMMPRLDGFGLLKALRADAGLRDIPVILLSARAGQEAEVEGLEAGADDYLVKPFSARELIARVEANIAMARLRREASDVLREEARLLRMLNETGTALAAELDLERLVQRVTDNAVALTGAQFGAFFYNLINAEGESYTLYTLSGAPREAFAKFPMPRNTPIFEPTFRGTGVVRSPDILQDPRYGRNPPYRGMPPGHLPVRSYLAVPVASRSGEVLGGLFFGHAETGIFTERAELVVSGIAAQAAVAIDNARLYRASQQAQAELKRLNDTLEQRVAAEIAERMKIEEALRQSQKMEAIGQLTGGVAHDFNNLLQVILSNLDALQRHMDALAAAPAAADWRRYVGAAARGAERGATLTQRLLAFSRRQPLAPKPTDVNKLVTGMSDLLHRTLGETVAVETVTAGGLWSVSVDPNQLESALLNLAVNARDAMPRGGKLTIETANAFLDEDYAALHDEVAPGQYVVICVSDTGTGMTREVIAKAFDPFFTTKDVGQGTGLGLSQVYGFVKQSGGHVKIYSEPGEGTTVKLYLPRLPGGSAAEEPAAATVVLKARTGEIVLLVEDDDEVRQATGELLRELGYGVVAVADGHAALKILEERSDIRLLFTDVGLPGGLNGRQLADAVHVRRPDLAVLFTTGYARNAIVHHGRLDPGIDLLVKPFTYAALASKLRQILDPGNR